MLSNNNQTQGVIREGENLHRKIDLIAGLLIAILNILEITMIAKIRRKKRIYEIILMSLSISDCMFGLSNVVVASIYISNSKKHDELLETAYICYAFFVLTSIFHLIFIAVDRVMIVLKPFQYKTIFTKKRLKIGIGVLWITAFTIGVITYTVYELTEMELPVSNRLNQSVLKNRTVALIVQPTTNENEDNFLEDIQLVLSAVIIMLDFSMVISYSIIIYNMSYKKRKSLVPKSVEDERLPILCVVIAAVFVLLTMPYAITRISFGSVPFWANFILLLNSGMNSLVYFFRQKIEKYHKQKNRNNQPTEQEVPVKKHLESMTRM